MISKNPKWRRFDMRLTIEDHSAWEACAKKSNMSLSELIRQRVNGGNDEIIDPGPPLLLRDARYVYHHPPEKDLTEGHRHMRLLKNKDFKGFCELIARLEKDYAKPRPGKKAVKKTVHPEEEEEDHALDLAKSLKAGLPK